MEVKSIKNVLVDIDSLFDTRLPIIYLLDDKLSTEIVESGKYHNRFTNDFKHVTKDIFKSIYRDRTKEILDLATPTGMVRLINNYCKESVRSDNITGGDGDLSIYINIYPYNLNLDECDLIKMALSNIYGSVEIKIVSMTIDEMDPVWVSDNISMMVLYNGMDWMERHISTTRLIKQPLVDIQLLAPAITDLSTNEFNKSIDNPDKLFTDIENSARTLIELNLLPAKDFSTIN